MSGFAWFGLIIVATGLTWRWACRQWYIPFPAGWGWMLWGIEPLIPAQMLLHAAQVKLGATVLDIGPGIGRVTIPAAHIVGPQGRVEALDVQPAMLNIVQRRAAAAGLGSRVCSLVGSADTYMLTPATYDCILMIDMLGEIPNRKAALRNVADALRPDGILLIAEVFGDPHYQRWGQVQHLLQDSGLHVQRHRCIGGYYVVCRR